MHCQHDTQKSKGLIATGRAGEAGMYSKLEVLIFCKLKPCYFLCLFFTVTVTVSGCSRKEADC